MTAFMATACRWWIPIWWSMPRCDGPGCCRSNLFRRCCDVWRSYSIIWKDDEHIHSYSKTLATPIFFGDFMARTSLGTDIRHKIDKVKIKMIKPRRDQVIRSNMCLGKRPLTIISATGYLILWYLQKAVPISLQKVPFQKSTTRLPGLWQPMPAHQPQRGCLERGAAWQDAGGMQKIMWDQTCKVISENVHWCNGIHESFCMSFALS